jgi:hypothetical protein
MMCACKEVGEVSKKSVPHVGSTCVRDSCGACWGKRPHKTYMVPPENMVYSQKCNSVNR